jgi:GNAT superfamily N-acetyltransferase
VSDRVVELAVRDAAESDAAAIAPLLDALGYPASADEVAARLRRLAAYPGSATALVAVDGGRVVGLLTAHAFPTVHGAAPAAWITALVVDPAARGRGVGRRLVRAAETWAATQGAARIAVTSATHRADAHRFYEGLGYDATGRRFARKLE